MNAETLDRIVDEIDRELAGKRFGRSFQLSANEIAIDVRGPAARILYINFSSGSPLIYLIRRKSREIERASVNSSPFVLALGKWLANGEIVSVTRFANERVARMDLTADDEIHGPANFSLIVQMTGRSSNLFIVDGSSNIVDRARKTEGKGQQVGDIYTPPEVSAPIAQTGLQGPDDLAVKERPDSPSDALDELYSRRAEELGFAALVDAAKKKNRTALKKLEGLKSKLEDDLERHGDAEAWKHFADLLLANVSTARREGGSIFVTDYFDEKAPEISIEADENLSVSEAAEHYYKRYTRARNALREVSDRLESIAAGIADLKAQEAEIERQAAAGNASFF